MLHGANVVAVPLWVHCWQGQASMPDPTCFSILLRSFTAQACFQYFEVDITRYLLWSR